MTRDLATRRRRRWPPAARGIVGAVLVAACAFFAADPAVAQEKGDAAEAATIPAATPVPAPPVTPAPPPIRFEEVGEAAGARHVHHTRSFGERTKAEVLEMFTDGGAAVAVGDFDGDGWDDLFLVDSGEGRPQHLLRNLTGERGELAFEDVAEAVGVSGGNSADAIVADALWLDYDNDGRRDLLISRFGTPILYRNLGPGEVETGGTGGGTALPRFADVSEAAGLAGAFDNTIASIAFDADGDGWLDLLLGHYFPPEDLLNLDTTHVLPNNLDQADNGGGLSLWRNVAADDGGRRFVEVTAEAGLAEHTGWSLDLGHGDLDNDGDQDVYVAGDYGTDRLFVNRGDGTFDDVTEDALGIDTRKGMNVDMGDYDRNGWLDVFVTNITDEYMRECNMLWHNGGDGVFIDVSRETGTCDSDWGWGGKFADLDNDGWEDIFTVNGLRSAGEENYIPLLLQTIITPDVDFSDLHSYPDIGDHTWSGYQRQRLFRNLGDGTFAEVAAQARVDNDLDGRGVAVADLDRDGLLDLVQTNARQPSLLFRNVSQGTGRWLGLRLVGGAGSNRDAVGTRVTVRSGDETWIREVDGGNGYAGQSTLELHFGLGRAETIDSVEIRWPSGRVDTLHGEDGASALAVDRLTVIEESADDDLSPAEREQRLAELRNLGKALYENPATQYEAVDVLAEALAMSSGSAPDSTRDRVNHALALLRAGQEEAGVAALEAAQEADPTLPHTWFNLGIAYKRAGRYDEALAQLRHMADLAPDDAITHYNLGVLHKLAGDAGASLAAFERAAELDPYLAGARFQLATAYRQAGDAEAAKRAMAEFRELKALQADDAVAEDLEWSYYSELYDPRVPADAAAPPQAEPSFTVRRLLGGLSSPMALHLLDADADGRTDLLVARHDRVTVVFDPAARAEKTGSIEGEKAGAGAAAEGVLHLDVTGLRAVAPGDLDNDGLPDLALVTAEGVSLLRNTGAGFEPLYGEGQSGKLPASATRPYRGATWFDYDHDYDVDLVLLGAESTLLRNVGEGEFADHPQALPFPDGTALDAVQLDLVPDTPGLDLAVSYGDRHGVILRDLLGARFAAEDLPALEAGAEHLAAADLDNDGWTDLVARGENGPVLLRNVPDAGFAPVDRPRGQAAAPAATLVDFENRGALELVAGGPGDVPMTVARNLGEGRFGPAVPLFDVALPFSPSALAAADFDRDGRNDLAVVTGGGELQLLLNRTETPHHWLTVDLTGVKNLKAAPGAEVEVKAGTSYQKKLWRGVPLTFGLGPHASVETVRITWPNGLIQNEPRQDADTLAAYEEAQRLSGSCPMVFTWNGSEMEFISDILGVAPLGAAAGDGVYFQVDHDEYLGIAGDQLAPRDGFYEVRMTEELREVGYVDLARLLVVDHPAEVTILHNDKFKGPPYPEFELFGIHPAGDGVGPIRPVAARDDRGHDALAEILEQDRVYPDRFRRDFAGIAELHHLDVDFGDADPEGRAVLVLYGWVDWADGSTFMSTAQAGGAPTLVMPHLQMKNAAGEWETVIQDLGLPAGKPKSIVVDLAGRWISDHREVRIITSLAVYWDQVYLALGAREPEVRVTELAPSAADLRFRGFSRVVVHPQRLQPESFVYADVSPTAMWNPTAGLYTRFGDVGELLQDIDDRFVVFGSGDELALKFPATGLPELPEGWTRDFLFFVDGWAKDGDANTAHSQTVGPLPFHAMPEYPYGAEHSFPDGPEHRRYVEEWLTRPALNLIRPLHTAGTARGGDGETNVGTEQGAER